MKILPFARLLTAIAAMALLTGAHAAPDEPALRLQLSTNLTLAPDGQAPVALQPVAQPTATPRSQWSWWPVLALGAIAGTLLGWGWQRARSNRQIERLARAWRAKQDGLRATNRALQNDLQAAHANGKDAWHNTLATVRDDLTVARRQLDKRIDEAAALTQEVATLQDARRAAHAERDTLDATLTQVRGQLLRAETALAELRTHAEHADHTLLVTREQAETIQGQLELRCEDLDALSSSHARLSDETDQLRNANKALQSRIEELEAAQGSSQNLASEQIAELRDALAHATRHADRSDAETAQARSALQQAEERIAEQDTAMANLRELQADLAAHNSNLQTMLRTAEDRVDGLTGALEELREENTEMRAQSAQSDEKRVRATAQNAALTALREENRALRATIVSRDRTLATASAPQATAAHADTEQLQHTIEQLTRSRDAALSEMRAVRARLGEATSVDGRSAGASLQQELTQARREIKMLQADLRVRSDVIKVLEQDCSQLPGLEKNVSEQASQLAFLNNELALALDEVARLRKARPATAARTARPQDTHNGALLARIDELEARLATKEQILQTLEEEHMGNAEQHDDSVIEQLRADQSASASVIRFLEGEVERLSAALGPTSQTG